MAKTGMEGMMLSILKGMGIDPDKLKEEFSGRVEQFERNVGHLNSNLQQINRRLANLELKMGLESEPLFVPPTEIEGTVINGRDTTAA